MAIGLARLLVLTLPSSHAGWCDDHVALSPPCRIEVIDKGNHWPVPMIELRTTDNLRLVTDNAGVIACDAPELMGRQVWFEISGNGYEVAKDGFGNRGVRLTPIAGKTLTIEVTRTIIAKRVGRLTGAGQFAESQRLGQYLDWHESGITGCDSVQCVHYHDRLLWLWGDSGVYSYPLGIFNSSGAQSDLPAADTLVPPLRLHYDYFLDEQGHPRGIAPIPGDGPTWVFGMAVIPDHAGQERVIGCYSKIRGMVEPYEEGLAAWNDERKSFERLKVIWSKGGAAPKPKAIPDGQAVLWTEAPGKEWLLFGNPFPFLRCPATFEAWQDPSTWQPLEQSAVVTSTTGAKVTAHTGCIAWNAWRKRWIAIFVEKGGSSSFLGELWYTEALQPTGPWGPAVKVLSHDHYTCYNPRFHPEFSQPGKPAVYFEGSYNTLFTDHLVPTPRYDYNQILYRLDLDDPLLAGAQGH
jgi:hypothetical protein